VRPGNNGFWAHTRQNAPRLDAPEDGTNNAAMALDRVPRRGERVRVEGHQGTFVVVRVDRVDNIANVELWDDPGVVVWDLPFDAIHLLRETVSQAA
jgi:hypothetical protein